LLKLSHRTVFAAAILASTGAILGSTQLASAQAPAGMLDCNVSPSVGAVVTSGRALSCVFNPVSGAPEFYTGTITTVGVDLGFTGPGKLSWGVAMAAPVTDPFPLAGTFTGATAGLTLFAGASANSLIGGNGNTVSLQPLSVSTQTGIDITAGIGTLTLTPVIPPAPPPPRGNHH
jgi:hypothetical protein